MANLQRAQIYIEEEQMQELKQEAEKQNLAVSELIRRAINSFLKSKVKSINWDNDPLTKAVGKIKLSVSNASKEHDYYLYGKRKRK